ncbi:MULTISPECIES: hypothetical protein [unclassified Pantoea]|uniref:hypothetical protein n=1 Tax=unclassified Pantoea TaxID=2630326 RepID=UPI001CD6739A|nr:MULTISPECIES: hypothetical protein [unclassified Pantoea]MCA1178047.1 hypothetical protein [Pantoea sp. alder69]MCA1252748.1 hypothetical protein [Pantoea sp. alder70]MCA1266189.1 hypothetical protein [Pantoea sp. alder81]
MLRNKYNSLEVKLWKKFIPLFIKDINSQTESPYNYFSVYFSDTEDTRYLLSGNQYDHMKTIQHVLLLETKENKMVEADLPTIVKMKCEIIHYRKNSSAVYYSIMAFVLDKYTKVLFLKSMISKGKGGVISLVTSNTLSLSHDRCAILKIMLSEHIKLRPSRQTNGFSEHDILSIIHGRLWYKHIRQEEYKVKLRLLLDSLVITDDLSEFEGLFYIQGKSINTIVDYEKELSLSKHQSRVQNNIFRLTIVLTALLAIIVLVLLALAGIVDLENVWSKVLEIKPVRFLMKFI